MKIQIVITMDLNNAEAVDMGEAAAAMRYYANQATAIDHLVAGMIDTNLDETGRGIMDGRGKTIGTLTITRTGE